MSDEMERDLAEYAETQAISARTSRAFAERIKRTPPDAECGKCGDAACRGVRLVNGVCERCALDAEAVAREAYEAAIENRTVAECAAKVRSIKPVAYIDLEDGAITEHDGRYPAILVRDVLAALEAHP